MDLYTLSMAFLGIMVFATIIIGGWAVLSRPEPQGTGDPSPDIPELVNPSDPPRPREIVS